MNRKLAAIVLFIILLPSCEELNLIDCDNCFETPPADCNLIIYTNNPFETDVYRTITVYEGPIENDLVLYRFTTLNETVYIWDAFLYKNYTVTAEYNYQNIKYTAVDAVCPEVKSDDSSCEILCYYIDNNEVNLRLRYR